MTESKPPLSAPEKVRAAWYMANGRNIGRTSLQLRDLISRAQMEKASGLEIIVTCKEVEDLKRENAALLAEVERLGNENRRLAAVICDLKNPNSSWQPSGFPPREGGQGKEE